MARQVYTYIRPTTNGLCVRFQTYEPITNDFSVSMIGYTEPQVGMLTVAPIAVGDDVVEAYHIQVLKDEPCPK